MSVEKSEYKEVPLNVPAEWLGGFFEVGGSMYFEIRNMKRSNATYTYAYPFLKYGDSDLNRLDVLTGLLGGKVNRSGRTYQWWAMSQHAVAIAETLKPYAPSRADIIAAFELWKNAEIEERIILAEDIIQQYPSTPTTKDDYTSLVRDPKFLAGALDARGVFYVQENFDNATDKSWGWNSIRMHLTTTNVGVAEAFQQVYGGHISVEAKKGEVRNFNGIRSILERDSVRWAVGAATCKELISSTQDYRKLQFISE